MSSALSQQVFQHHVVQHRVCQQPLELGILVLKGLQPGRLGHFHTAILGLQFVERSGAQPVPAAHLSRRHPSLLFLDHPDYLRLGETALSHESAPSELAQTLHHGEGFRGGQVTIETAKMNSLNPQAYLTDILSRIHDHKINKLDELLPWNWAPAEAEDCKAA